MPLFLSPEEGAADHIDLLRHTLGNLIVPRTAEDIRTLFARAEKEGSVLPSGRSHLSGAGSIRDLLKELENAGYAQAYSGFDNHSDLNAATVRDARVVDHPPSGDPVQPETRGDIWAMSSTSDITEPHWIMTKQGFEALNGFAQGGS